jgi:hypothetical protein
MNYTFSQILSSSAIGDSLSDINTNYSNLNDWVNDIQYSYNNEIIPVIGFFFDNLNYIQDSLTFIQSNSANLNTLTTLVFSNSAKWLNPITAFYPEILSNTLTQSTYLEMVGTWLNANYPVNNSNTIVPNYVQNQQAVVYLHRYTERVNNNSSIQTASTICKTKNDKIVANCVTYSTGIVHCNQTTFNCNDTKTKKPFIFKCAIPQDSNCSFDSPYISKIVQGLDMQATGYIKANVGINYVDRQELQDMITMSFKVVDCNWVFDKFLVA